MVGDIHHWAWRATLPNETVYLNPRDAQRFGNWTTEMVSGAVTLQTRWLSVSGSAGGGTQYGHPPQTLSPHTSTLRPPLRQCDTEECVEAHTMVDVVVDVPAVMRLLTGRLELLGKGATVEEAALPWPPR